MYNKRELNKQSNIKETMILKQTYGERSKGHAHSSKAIKNQRNEDEYGKF